MAEEAARLGSTSGEATALDAAIEVALERRALLHALREALRAGDTEMALNLAHELTGLVDSPSNASSITR